jgi:guanyl-specific ribonuclease Sa
MRADDAEGGSNLRRWVNILLLVVLALVAAQWWLDRADHVSSMKVDASRIEVPSEPSAVPAHRGASRYPSFLPPEGIATIELIERGGPFPYHRDGSVFQNRERRLPAQPSGYYREYTVPTPGLRDRGARRIVSGGNPPEVYFYTDDHYRSFRRVEVPR